MTLTSSRPSEEKILDFASELRGAFSGEIRMDRHSRLLYSTDASIYQIEPLGVLIPRTHDDVAAAVALAHRFHLPLLSRGGGTSLAGQTVGAAMVLDYSKFMNRVLEVNTEEAWARIQPGVVLDQLNAHLKPVRLQFGPDVSTSNRATIGGMIGNNSCGSHSILYGKTIDHIKDLRVILSNAQETVFAECTPERWRQKAAQSDFEGNLYRTVERLATAHASEIEARYPKIMRRVGGYNLDQFLGAGDRNLCRMIVGSEGTLAAYTEARVNLVPAPKLSALYVIHFADLVAAMEATEAILTFEPAAVELIDKMLLDLTRRQPAFARKMTFVEGDPEALLIVEFYGESAAEIESKISRLDAHLKSRKMGFAFVHAKSVEEQANVWTIRKAGLGLLSSIRGDSKPVAFVEDTAVDPRLLGPYVARFQKILERHGTRAGFYGHASVGCLHIRPMVDLKQSSGVDQMVNIAAAVKDLVVEFKGAMSAEHGDGLVRSHWNRELFGEPLYEAFCILKSAFDSDGILNPGKIVHAPKMTEHLRYGPSYSTIKIETFFDFTREGGLASLVEQCNGMGACRKKDVGTMCPSYMATCEEEHSTRGRASLLRSVLSGRLGADEFTGRRMFEALDLCLECKACKTECPANVDMAKLKYEFLGHYNARHGTPLRSRAFANIARLSRWGSALAPLSNFIVRSHVFRASLQRLLGIDPRRTLPSFASTSFRRWLARHRPEVLRRDSAQVILFNDTFTNYNEPSIGRSTLELLESASLRVHVPDTLCCGRPMISKGLLAEAKENARRNVSLLFPLVEAGATIVGCEPSCLLTLRDEYPDLLRTAEARQVADSSQLSEEFLAGKADTGEWKPQFREHPGEVLFHGHCHQKSLSGTAPSLRVLRLLPGTQVREIDAGCCGMAGSFGYEKEHFDLSLRIGESRLLPQVRAAAAEAEIVASGFSCRQQILHGTGRRARHLTELLADSLKNASS